MKMEEQSIKTSTSSCKKEGESPALAELHHFDQNLPGLEWGTITMKQVNAR